jgi:SP family myo-inositol transporter-like MFS transporter 13
MIREISRNFAVKKAMAIGCALQAFQQLGGINTVMYYSTTMIKMAGISNDSLAIWLSCIPSFINAAFALVSMSIVEKVPRRKLLLSTLSGTALGRLRQKFLYFDLINFLLSVSLIGVDSLTVFESCMIHIITVLPSR